MKKALILAGAFILLSALNLTQAAEPLTLRESVTPVVTQPIPNIPGKTLTSVVVDYPPGAQSRSHRHAASALIYAYVLSGTIRSQVGAEAPKLYRAGQFFIELPGSHHVVSANASTTEAARMLVVFVADEGARLTVPDQNQAKGNM
jgi:quercetin dioxygenase-like cupin family protein